MTDIDHTSRAHAKLSASGSAMWINCSGSIAANALYKSGGSSAYADEGTAAHELGEACLRTGNPATKYLGKMFNGFIVDEDMARYVQEYVDYVNALLTPESILKVEQKLEFTDWVPEGFGTGDVVIIQPNGIIHVVDLKFGQGVEVSAVDNTQGQLYALGVYQEYSSFVDIKAIHIHIVQPRKNNFSEWAVKVDDLLEFGDFVKERAQAALQPNAPRTPSEKACRWCAHKSNCVELADFTQKLIANEFEELDVDEVPSLSDSRKASILQHKGLIEQFLKAVEDSVFKQIASGSEFKGYKIVEGRSIRKWTDNAESILAERLGEDAYTKKLIGITDAQKHLGKALVDELTEKPSGKPTLVPDSDKRKPITNIVTEEEFENI